MVTGIEVRDSARSFEGEPYRQDNPGRYLPDSGFKDCSGDVVAAFARLGIQGVPTVSSTQARWCFENGGLISVELALATPGCLLSRGANFGMEGYGNDGHSAITIGDKVNVTEARGSAYGVLMDSALGRQWDAGYLFPRSLVDYAEHPAPAPKPHKPPKLKRKLYYRKPPAKPFRGDDVLEVKSKLLVWAYITRDKRLADIEAHAPQFGRACGLAVMQYQRHAGLPANGIVGPATWASLFRV